jgi:cytochrome c553
VLQSYKMKDRPNQVMQTITAGLGDPEMHALAAYYASLKPK